MLQIADQNKVFQDALIQINEIILEDNLVSGDRLPSERELSERLKIGRSSVREALRALELLGLITTRRGEGTFIAESTSHRLVEILASFILRHEQSKRDLLEMRAMIEGEAAKLAALRRTEANVQELHQCLIRMKDFVDRDLPVPYVEQLEFHQLIVTFSNNSLLFRVWEPLIKFASFTSHYHLLSAKTTYEGFELIYEAIKNESPIAATSAMNQHLSRTSDVIKL